MSLKYIAVLLDGGNSDMRQTLAVDIAREYGAHLHGLFVSVSPAVDSAATPIRSGAGYVHTPGLAGDFQGVGAAAGAAQAEAPRAEPFAATEQQVENARRSFERAVESAGVDGEFELVSSREQNAWQGLLGENILCDLLVAGKPTESDDKRHFQRFVTESGIPVLVVPASVREWSGRDVVIGWNGSSEALRAVRAALPLIETAKSATVVMVKPKGEVATSAKRLVQVLQAHGVDCDDRRDPGGEMKASDALVSHGETSRLLVVGAYGRSRLEKMVFGGTTRNVIDQATMPVLVAH